MGRSQKKMCTRCDTPISVENLIIECPPTSTFEQTWVSSQHSKDSQKKKGTLKQHNKQTNNTKSPKFTYNLLQAWKFLFVAMKNNRYPHSTEYYRKTSGIFQIFHCNWNNFATLLLNIAKYFIATLQFQLYEFFYHK